MAKAYSMDLRERVVEAVELDGLSRTRQLRVRSGDQHSDRLVNRYRETAAWRWQIAGIGRRSLL